VEPVSLRLGIIGLSEGNGHPYSWSAIFNGYDSQKMEHCGFPVITKYLSEQRWPDVRISGAVVTHVWTQDEAISYQIARASLINNVVTSPSQMIGEIDALLLARDDAENHLKFAEPFLEAGIPIYVDKPIAVDRLGLETLLDRQVFEGQIYSCSALRYALEIRLGAEDHRNIGEIRKVVARTPKKWDTYSVHIIEPVLRFLAPEAYPISAEATGTGDERLLVVQLNTGVSLEFESTGDRPHPLSFTFEGTRGSKTLEFKDSFSAFREALKEFVGGVVEGRSRLSETCYRRVVSLIEAGRCNGRHSFGDRGNRQAWTADDSRPADVGLDGDRDPLL
jgi:hypothetical protein